MDEVDILGADDVGVGDFEGLGRRGEVFNVPGGVRHAAAGGEEIHIGVSAASLRLNRPRGRVHPHALNPPVGIDNVQNISDDADLDVQVERNVVLHRPLHTLLDRRHFLDRARICRRIITSHNCTGMRNGIKREREREREARAFGVQNTRGLQVRIVHGDDWASAVCRAIESVVMDIHIHVVAGEADVQLDQIRTQTRRLCQRSLAVLRRIDLARVRASMRRLPCFFFFIKEGGHTHTCNS